MHRTVGRRWVGRIIAGCAVSVAVGGSISIWGGRRKRRGSVVWMVVWVESGLRVRMVMMSVAV